MYVVAHNGSHTFGGAERGTARILAGLQERGHRVQMFCNDAAVARGVEVLGVRTARLPLGGDIAAHHALRFASELRQREPDVLLAGTFKKVWLAGLAAKLAGVPKVVLRIGLETDVPRNLKYRLAIPRLVDTVVLKADDVRPLWEAALPQMDAGRLVTILGGVEPPLRNAGPGAVRRILGIDPQTSVIGTVARLAEQKRLDRLIETVAMLPPSLHCILAGDGEQRGKLEDQALRLGVRGRVHFLGHRSDVGDVLAALDLFIVTSDREMLCFAMLEALAAGVPVVSTPVSGASVALEADAAGDAPGEIVGFNAAEIALVIRRLVADRHRLERMGGAAHRRASERFGFEPMIDRWEAVLAAAPVRRG